MADWVERQINKKLCEQFPYLVPRNVFTDKIPEDYDYDYILGEYELPKGWHNLFFQMCQDIKKPLINNNYLEKFRFSQIKEKYGTMRCYVFGAPEEVHNILHKYEYLSQFICESCGKPAKYVTSGWIGSYCEDCIKNKLKPEYINECETLQFDPIMKIIRYSDDKKEHIEVDCSDEWNRYLKVCDAWNRYLEVLKQE